MFLNRFFFSFGDFKLWLLALLNCLMVTFVLWRIAGYAGVRLKSIAPSVFIATSVYLLWFTPDVLGEILLWKTEHIQYFWLIGITVFCFHPVIKDLFFNLDITQSRIQKPVYLLVCFIGGMWLEHVSVAVAAAWILVLGFEFFVLKNKRVARHLAGLISWGLGCVALIAAPGNYARAKVMGESLSLGEKVFGIVSAFLDKLDFRLLAAVLIFLLMHWLFSQRLDPARVKSGLLFLTVAILAALACVGAPHMMFFGRIAGPSEVFLVLACMCLFPTFVFSGQNPGLVRYQLGKYALVAISFYSVSALAQDYKTTFTGYWHVYNQSLDRREQILAALESGKEHVEFLPLYFTPKIHTGYSEVNQGRWFARDVTRDVSRWENKCFSNAHGIGSVVIAI